MKKLQILERLYSLLSTPVMLLLIVVIVLYHFYAIFLSKDIDKTYDRLFDFLFKEGRLQFLMKIKSFFRSKKPGVTRQEIEKLGWSFKDYTQDGKTEVFTRTDKRENTWELYHKERFVSIALMEKKEEKERPIVFFNGFPKGTYDLFRIMRTIGIALKIKDD